MPFGDSGVAPSLRHDTREMLGALTNKRIRVEVALMFKRRQGGSASWVEEAWASSTRPRTSVSGNMSRSSSFPKVSRVLCPGLSEDRDVEVGVVPEGEQILVGRG